MLREVEWFQVDALQNFRASLETCLIRAAFVSPTELLLSLEDALALSEWSNQPSR